MFTSRTLIQTSELFPKLCQIFSCSLNVFSSHHVLQTHRWSCKHKLTVSMGSSPQGAAVWVSCAPKSFLQTDHKQAKNRLLRHKINLLSFTLRCSHWPTTTVVLNHIMGHTKVIRDKVRNKVFWAAKGLLNMRLWLELKHCLGSTKVETERCCHLLSLNRNQWRTHFSDQHVLFINVWWRGIFFF